MPHPYPEGAEYEFLDLVEREERNTFAIEAQGSDAGRFLGVISYKDSRYPHIAPYEFGYWVDPKFWGQGVGTLALGILLDLAKNDGVKSICAAVIQSNIGSKKVLEKNGFEYVEDGEIFRVAHDRPYPSFHYRNVL